MNTVTFPGLGLTFELNRVAFCLGDFCIYWYGIIIGLGFILGGGFCCWRAKDFGLKGDDILDLLLFAGPGGIIGARLYYIIFNPDLYKNADGSLNFKAMLNVHNGGLAIYGGIIGAIAIGSLYCKKIRFPLYATYDIVGLGFLIGQTFGRWGNFFNQEAFGSNTTLPWGMYSQGTHAYLASQKGILGSAGIVVDPSAPVHPCFLYESLWCLLGFVLIHSYIKHRKFDGQLFLMYIAWYGAGRFVIEGLRTDSLMLGSFRVSQLVAFACVAVGVALIIAIRSKQKDENDEEYLKPFGKRENWRQQLAADMAGLSLEEYLQKQASDSKEESENENQTD